MCSSCIIELFQGFRNSKSYSLDFITEVLGSPDAGVKVFSFFLTTTWMELDLTLDPHCTVAGDTASYMFRCTLAMLEIRTLRLSVP